MKTIPDCIFCKIINRQIANDIIYEDEKVIVIVDIDWAVKGHTLVIWKDHVKDISELSEDEYLYFSKIVYKTEKILLKQLSLPKSVILKSGGYVDHLHFHIYPVQDNIDWKTVLQIINKEVKYVSTGTEKEDFFTNLRKTF